MITKIEAAQLAILDVLIENDGIWTGPDRQVLESLAMKIHGQHATVGSPEYQLTSMAVLRLEAHGMVSVDRRYQDEHAKANIIERVRIT